MTQEFGETYRSLTDDAILKLWDERSQLVREAKVSLSNEIRRRSLSVKADVMAKSTAHEAIRRKKLRGYHNVVRLVGSSIAGAVFAFVPALSLSILFRRMDGLFFLFLLVPFTILFTIKLEKMWRHTREKDAVLMREKCRQRFEKGEPPLGK